jgi:hypothetical protein
MPLSAQAFIKFSASSTGAVEWENIADTPTTLDGYGITDAVLASEIQVIQETVDEVKENLPDTTSIPDVAEARNIYNAAVNNLNIINDAFSNLDAAIAKLEAITN